MATRDEYINKGYTNEQIDSAFLNKMATGQKTNVAPGAPVLSAQVTPIGIQKTEGTPLQTVTPPQQQKAKTNLNAPISSVPAPQATTIPVDSGNILAVRANQTPEEKAWQVKQDAFDQARTGVNPAPAQIEKTTTITPEGQTVVKKETPGEIKPDYNVGKGREQEIAQNLQEGFANDPAIQKAILNGDRASFDMAYGYSESDPTKQKILDYFFKSRQPSSPDEYFNQMIQGISMNNPSLQKNPLFQKAKTRFNDLNINAGLTTNELSDKIRDGSINIGSQAYTDLQMKNPELIRKAEMLNSINTGKGNAKVDGNAVLTNVTENITKDVAKEDIPNYQNMLAGNTQVKDALAKKTETETKMNGLQDTLDNLDTDIRKQYEGKDVTEGYIQALISEKSKPIVRQLSTLGRTYSSQLANLQYYSDIVKEEYNTKKEERKTASDRAYEATKDTREFGQQKQLADYQAQLGLKTKQAEFEQQMAQKAQIANDPVLATQDVLDTYAKLGILPERSQSEIIQSVQNDIAGGMTLGQSLTNLNKAFQSKPQYQAIQAKAKNENVAYGKVGVNTDTGEDIMGWINKSTQTITPYSGTGTSTGATTTFTGMDTDLRNSEYVKQYPNEASFKNNNPAGITWNTNFDNGTGIAKALQDAGITFSKGTARPASEGGNYVQFDNIGDGMKARQVVFGTTYGNKDLSQALQSWKEGSNRNAGTQQYANSIMAEAGINPNQSITYNNLSQEQKDALTLSQIKRESGGLYKVLTQTPKTETQATTFDENKASSYNKYIKDGILPTGMKLGYGKANQFIKEATEYSKTIPTEIDPKKQAQIMTIQSHFDSQPQVKDYNSSQGVNQWLQSIGNTDLSGPDIQGLISNYAKILDPTSVVRESEYAMAQAGASQGYIDKTKQQIATFISGGSNVLSKEAQEVLKKAMQKRVDSMTTAYKDYATTTLNRSRANGIDLTYEMLTGVNEQQPDQSEAPTYQQFYTTKP